MTNNINSLLTKIFIAVSISLITSIPASNLFPLSIVLLIGGITAFFMLLLFLINDYILMPGFYFKKTKSRFVMFNILMLLSLTLLFTLVDKILIKPHILYEPKHDIPWIFFMMRYLFIFLLANFISISLYLTNTVKKQALREKDLKEEKLSTELKLLKAQINPHFIFNALNNLYALSYTRSEKAPESILKLSEMLRYVFYDCSKDVVKLSEEIHYIENFISFQQMKSEHEQHIVFHYSNADPTISISPMLFTPFIENAFKYSKIEEESDAFIDIKLSTEKEKLRFYIKNTIPGSGKPMAGKGMGLPNVKQRLRVLYPGRHELRIEEKDQFFTVNLQIDTR